MSELPFKVKAVYSYTSPHEDDLNFSSGQIITVTEEEDNDWFYGHYIDHSGDTKEGIFPRNFVERVEPDAPPRPARSHRARKSAGADASAIQEPSRPDRSQDEGPPVDEASEQAGGFVAAGLVSHRDPIHTEHGSPSMPSQKRPPSKADTDPRPKTEPNRLPSQAPSAQSKTGPPVASSFRDRIAAFNKPTAPPIAPFKPAGLGQGSSTFIKKPYVPPPPSRDAYVPPPRETPQKVYRREEDAEAEAPSSQEVRVTEISTRTPDEESQQKPTSLKERIALLQKQQLENAARQSEATQKREAAKRPPKQRMGSFEDLETNNSEPGPDSLGAPQGAETNDEISGTDAHNDGLTERTFEPIVYHPTSTIGVHDFPSDANDADQSGLDELAEDVEGHSTEQDDNDRATAGVASNRSVVQRTPASPDRESSGQATRHGDGDDDQEDDDVDFDPEVKRRMEIRERMAKMSGGMGMHGMFGMPGGIPRTPLAGAKKDKAGGGISVEKGKSERKHVELHDRGGSLPHGPSVPVLPPLPRSQSFGVRERTTASPADIDAEPAPEVSRETLVPEEAVQAEETEARKELPPQMKPAEQLAPSTLDRGARPVAEPTEAEKQSPRLHLQASLPSDEAATVDPSTALSPSAGSESDDEMSLYSRIPEPAKQPSIPPRESIAHPAVLPPSVSATVTEPGPKQTGPSSPINASNRDQRSSQALDAGGPNSESFTLRDRPPPPPPPPERVRITGGDAKLPKPPKSTDLNATEEEVTEYDGDYDTDIASSATHKAALSAPVHDEGDDSSNVSGNVVTSGATSSRIKTAPPIPRLPAPRARRQSASKEAEPPITPITDMPRGAPPPIPAVPRQEPGEDDYDPYRYMPPVEDTSENRVSYSPSRSPPFPTQPGNDEENFRDPPRIEDEQMGLSPRSSQEVAATPLAPPKVQGFHVNQPQALSQSMTASSRESREMPRPYASGRKSMEQSRLSTDQGHIARDVDLGRSSLWWAQPNKPPPTFQNRADLIYEVEESRTPRRGGKMTIAKDVYILFQDYSQTIVTARFDPGAVEEVSLEQRHEPPPARLRQDHLEDSQTQFGRRLAEDVKAKQNAVVGDGSPQSLITELLRPIPGALMPIGTRAFGAMIYLNLANASIQQHDEIRPGDIISFRNARFQGHKGTMHQKYNMEVGKPDHVGIVMDWDGTKKKVRAWEQGRDSKKVKLESFKLGDLRSGEVKVWRVVGRSWVGWESQS